MRSQLASQPANEEPALFVNIFFLDICQYIFFENLSIYFFLKICPYIFNFGHLGCQNSLLTQECQATHYLPTLDISQYKYIWQIFFLILLILANGNGNGNRLLALDTDF